MFTWESGQLDVKFHLSSDDFLIRLGRRRESTVAIKRDRPALGIKLRPEKPAEHNVIVRDDRLLTGINVGRPRANRSDCDSESEKRAS